VNALYLLRVITIGDVEACGAVIVRSDLLEYTRLRRLRRFQPFQVRVSLLQRPPVRKIFSEAGLHLSLLLKLKDFLTEFVVFSLLSRAALARSSEIWRAF
jgi:hypothetical protein